MSLPSLSPHINPSQLRECIGMAEQDVGSRIVAYEQRIYSYQEAARAAEEQRTSFLPLIEDCKLKANSLSKEDPENQKLQTIIKAIQEAMVILHSSFRGYLESTDIGIVNKTALPPFEIPRSVLNVAHHILSLGRIYLLKEIKRPISSLSTPPPLKVIGFGSHRQVIKLPVHSRGNINQGEFVIHTLVRNLPCVLPLAWTSTSELVTPLRPFTLKRYVKKFPELESSQYQKLLCDLLTGLFHLHAKGVVHCDIKPDNLFITDEGSLEIGDFGLSSITGDSHAVKGSLGYFAPEILTEGYTAAPPRDIWAVGIVIWQICTKKPFSIYTEPRDYCEYLRSPLLQELIDATIKGELFPPHLGDLLVKMLRTNPRERITAKEALEHPYFLHLSI